MIMERFLADLKAFVTPLIETLGEHKIIGDIREIDHVCYRVHNLDRYDYWMQELGKHGVLLSDAVINGRPICTYKLHQKILFAGSWSLDLVELPSPKPGSPYQEGFEHVEAVTRETLERFMARHPDINFNTSNLGAQINRDVSVKFAHGLVKFHELSLEAVIAKEKELESLGEM